MILVFFCDFSVVEHIVKAVKVFIYFNKDQINLFKFLHVNQIQGLAE